MRGIRASGFGTPETSYYGPLERLVNHAGSILKPKVMCIPQPRDSGVGRPDFYLHVKDRMTRHTLPLGLAPDRGVIEAKPLSTDVSSVSERKQVSDYLGLHPTVLVTNYWDFLLVTAGRGGQPPVVRERFKLATSETEFWALAADPKATAARIGDRLIDFLVRVIQADQPIDSPQQVASFLASYAREARGRLEGADVGLAPLRSAIEEALGLEFKNDEAEDFFRSTIVQTLFYGLFSGWVLWHGEKPDRDDKYDWKTASWTLHVPAVRALFEQLARPSGAGRLGLSEPLDWAASVLDRVRRDRFFLRFEQEHAVQYFYEPFLKEFDPELRKQLGVWYTPPEVVSYMVSRVDTVLREELGIAEGLADPSVVVLDPCCGTGAYLVEVLRRIEATLRANRGGDALIGADVKKAAMERVFGFEIMPAPFVVSHLQLGLHLRRLRAPLVDEERPAVFLTNALTGWEPAQHPKLALPELEAERDAAEHVKQDRRILVIIGNPPYNGYAGVAVDEERGLTTAYRATSGRVPKPRGQGLNDLYVRFFRMAERRITEKTGLGVVCFISNYSWLDGLSFTGMREQYLDRFDRIWIDSLNGDKYRTGKMTPDGGPDPSIFSTESNREGIQVGTAISLLVRKEAHARPASVAYRDLWGTGKRAQLKREAGESGLPYVEVLPSALLGLPFAPSGSAAGYEEWPSLPDLLPISVPGIKTSRDQLVVDIDRSALVRRMEHYFDARIALPALTKELGSAVEDGPGYSAEEVRRYLVARGLRLDFVSAFAYRPFDQRWLYWERETSLLDRRRDELLGLQIPGNRFLAACQQNRKEAEPAPIASSAASLHLIERGANLFPLHRSDGSFNLANAAGTRGYKGSEIFFHACACLHSPAYLLENAPPLRLDWPRIPLPLLPGDIGASAELGRKVADLVGASGAVPDVTTGVIRPELRVLGLLVPSADRLEVTGRWGVAGQGGVAMPGPGQTNRRAYSDEERSALEQGAADARRSAEDFIACLGAETMDVYLNGTAYWKNVPIRVWEYRMGGYQVLKKWLSYREFALLKRALTVEEARHFQDVVRRIAALLLLGPELDDNYRMARDTAVPWERTSP